MVDCCNLATEAAKSRADNLLQSNVRGLGKTGLPSLLLSLFVYNIINITPSLVGLTDHINKSRKEHLSGLISSFGIHDLFRFIATMRQFK